MSILTAEAANQVLRLDEPNPVVEMLLPAIDEYLKTATGHDWAADSAMNPLANAAAQMLLVQWFENPGMVGTASSLSFGLDNLIAQLQAKALIMSEGEAEA